MFPEDNQALQPCDINLNDQIAEDVVHMAIERTNLEKAQVLEEFKEIERMVEKESHSQKDSQIISSQLTASQPEGVWKRVVDSLIVNKARLAQKQQLQGFEVDSQLYDLS